MGWEEDGGGSRVGGGRGVDLMAVTHAKFYPPTHTLFCLPWHALNLQQLYHQHRSKETQRRLGTYLEGEFTYSHRLSDHTPL